MSKSAKFVILNVLQIVSEDSRMSKFYKADTERYFGTFSQVNIYVVDSDLLKRFLGSKSLREHYNDWLNGDIYSNQYILNVLKNKMESIEFNNAYHLMRAFGNVHHFKFEQNAFYNMSVDDIDILLESALKMADHKPKNFVFKKQVQKLERLQNRADNQKLKGKTLLISTW